MKEHVTERVNGSVPVMDAASAAELVPADGTVPMGGIGGAPKLVPHELAQSDRDLSLTVPASADAGMVADTELPMADAVEKRYPFSTWPTLRESANDGSVRFTDGHFSEVGRQVALGTFGTPDVAIVEAAAVGEDWFVPPTAVGAVPAFVDAADELIIEVNDAVPLSVQSYHDVVQDAVPPRDAFDLAHPGDRAGDQFVRFDPDKLVAVVESSRPPAPYPFRDTTDTERAIAGNVIDALAAELDANPALAEQFTFEVGVGTLGNEIMGRIDELEFGDRTVRYFGEVVQDDLLPHLEDGTIDSASATGIVLGPDHLEEFFAEADTYADRIVTRPSSVSNNPALVRRFGVVAINNAVEVDIYGHANSSHVRGSDLLQGIGGSGDFARNALVSVMALPSTAKDGAVSRIVPMCTHVDHPNHDVDVVVTEHGVADLRGLGPREAADEVIDSCAHPDFRADLRAYRDRADEQAGHLPHDLETAFDPVGPAE